MRVRDPIRPLTAHVELPPGPVTPEFVDSLKHALDDLIPTDRKGVFLAVATQDGITAGVAVKLGDNWQAGADFSKEWGGDVQGRVMIMATW